MSTRARAVHDYGSLRRNHSAPDRRPTGPNRSVVGGGPVRPPHPSARSVVGGGLRPPTESDRTGRGRRAGPPPTADRARSLVGGGSVPRPGGPADGSAGGGSRHLPDCFLPFSASSSARRIVGVTVCSR